MRHKKLIILLLLIFINAGCATVTITPNGEPILDSKPTFSEKQTFFLFGLIGECQIDVETVCGEDTVVQLQTQDTISDNLLGMITLGIYSPRTAKIWCKKGE